MSDFLKKFKQGIDKSVATVSIKSSTVLETSRVRAHIRTLKEKIEQSKIELGELVYAMYLKKEFDPEACTSLCEGITELEQQCEEQELIIEKLKEQELVSLGKENKEKVCECGTVLEEERKFCAECGKKI